MTKNRSGVPALSTTSLNDQEDKNCEGLSNTLNFENGGSDMRLKNKTSIKFQEMCEVINTVKL